LEGALRDRQAPLLAAAAALTAAAGAAAAEVRNPFLVVAAVLGAGYVLLAFRNLTAALAIFIPFTFVEQLPGAGSGVTLVKGMGAVLALVWVIGVARGTISLRGLGGARGAVVAGAVALVVWSFASAAWAFDSHAAVSSALRLSQGVILVVILATALHTRAALRLCMLGFVGGATLSAVVGLAGVGSAAADTPGADSRVGGGLSDPNFLAAVLVAGIGFAFALGASSGRRQTRIALAVASLVMAVALVRTESRGGVVALAAALVAAVVFGGRLRRPILSAALAFLVAAGVYLAVGPSSAHRLVSFGGGGSGRTELWSIASQVFRSHPLGGVGAGNFPIVEGSYAATTHTMLTKPYQEVILGEVVHNTYLHVAAELGVVGLALLGVVVVGAVALGISAIRSAVARRRGKLELLARGLLVGGIGMLVAFAFLSAQYEKQLWIGIGLLVSAHALAHGAVREEEPAVETTLATPVAAGAT
jgi:putative inorganic carbon (hco3(-)) transporter